MKTKYFVTLVSFLIISFSGCQRPAVSSHETTEIDVLSDPLQQPVDGVQAISMRIGKGIFFLQPVARYHIAAEVVSTESYSRGWQGEISPLDLALVWGRLTDPEVQKEITFRQRRRWYYYRYSAAFPFDKNFIITHSSNNHIIPATENIRRALETINTGDLIALNGYLVKIKGKISNRNYWWNSSLSRKDSGDGSCEVIYVERLRVGNNVYR